MKTIKEIGLFFIAIALSPLLIIGFVFSLVKMAIRVKIYQWWDRLGTYFRLIAISIDQLGNVMCQDLFNWALIKDDSAPFGNEDETISSVMGRHRLMNNLTWLGKLLDLIFELFEKNHSVNSIEKNH